MTPTPSGDLRINSPAAAAHRHAVSASHKTIYPVATLPAQHGLFRFPDLVPLAGVVVNHDRVTVPPVAGLSFRATKNPANAPDVTLSVVGDNATIATGTTIDNTTGAITVASAQTGGSAHVEASQNATEPDGSSLVRTATAPFNFTAIPSGIASTNASPVGSASEYGGQFTHTFTSSGGGQTALEWARVNERFAAANGTRLIITGQLGSLEITVNNPNSPSAGWNLDSSGTMAAPDNVTWDINSFDARPFVVNASNPSPTSRLPQALSATQDFRNLTFPNLTYSSAAVASTTHRRAFEERDHRIKAVTSANNREVVEDYMGPTVFRFRAPLNPIPVNCPASPGGTASPPTTWTIAVDSEGQAAEPTFSILPPDLGCTITPNGVLTPGKAAGRVTIRAGDSTNFDETTVTLRMLPPALGTYTINSGAASTTGQGVTLNNSAPCSPEHSEPTHYMASEDANFTGASWQKYSPSPSFTLSAGYGVKTVHLKLKNDAGESGVLNDTIEYVAPPVPSPSPAPQP